MTRRRLLLFGLFGGLLALGLGGWALWPGSAITCGNAARIQIGMTLKEVEDILGGPARCETTGPVTNGQFVADYKRGPLEEAIWISDSAFIIVRFDDGVVGWKHCFPVHLCEEPIEIIRRWLRL